MSALPLNDPDPADDAAIEAGRAGWVASSYGHEYLALPHAPLGTRVRVCGVADCVERASTDVGQGGVATLSRRDFEAVTSLEAPDVGTTAVVTVEYLDHPNHPNEMA